MKRLIHSSSDISSTELQGSYVVDKNGNLIEVSFHVPSTTFMNRNISHLAPTDAEFLLNQDLITEAEAYAILIYCFVEYLADEVHLDNINNVSQLNYIQFRGWADLKYAPWLDKLLYQLPKDKEAFTNPTWERLYESANDRFYEFLKNNFVKLSIYGTNAEFRIQSEDGFDWNKVIIDDVILKYEKQFKKCKITIVRESSKGYKAYCIGVTFDQLLEMDKLVLSAKQVYRHVNPDGSAIYIG